MGSLGNAVDRSRTLREHPGTPYDRFPTVWEAPGGEFGSPLQLPGNSGMIRDVGNHRERLPRGWEVLPRMWETQREVGRAYGKEDSGPTAEDRTLGWESRELLKKKAGRKWERIGEREEGFIPAPTRSPTSVSGSTIKL